MGGMPIAIPGKNPGELYIPSANKTIQQTESREDDVYDTDQQKAGAISAGNKIDFFKTITSKNLQATNITTPRRLAQGDELYMNRVGVHIHQSIGNTMTTDSDIVKIAHAGSLAFKLGRRLVTEGPLYKYQSGYGVVGQTTRNNTGMATIGVASYAAAPQMIVVQPVTENDDLIGTVRFDDNAWANTSGLPTLDADNWLSILLHGVLKSPLGK